MELKKSEFKYRLLEKAGFDVFRLSYLKYGMRDHNEGHGGFALRKDLILEDVRQALEARKDKVTGKNVSNYFTELLAK